MRKTTLYIGYVALVCLALTLKRPERDFITIDYVSLAAGFGNILIGLGGFSITVLAVLLGLEALDTVEDKTAAHLAAVRHVAISMAIAAISCFVGANLMSEVNSMGTGVANRRAAFMNTVETKMRAAEVPDAIAAKVRLEMESVPTDGFVTPESIQPKIEALLGSKSGAILGDSLSEMDRVLESSIHRHILLAGLPMYLASCLILQSLSILLLIRFPRAEKLHELQHLAVLGVSAMLLIKLLNAVSYGMSTAEFYGSRISILIVFAVVASIYAPISRRAGQEPDNYDIAKYTPLTPYYVSLGTAIFAMFYLAATFSNFAAPTLTDRVLVGLGAVVCTAFVLVLQLEQPTIELLRRE